MHRQYKSFIIDFFKKGMIKHADRRLYEFGEDQ